MLKKILSFINPCHLNTADEQLIITSKIDGAKTSRPLEDIGFVILDNKQITFTQAVLQLMAMHNVAVVICDEKHHPASMMLHLDVHHIQAERFRHQIAATVPLRKNLWMQTVKEKIRNQAKVVSLCGGNPIALINLANKVKTGDSTNIEAQAARIYWKMLFGPEFSRDRYGLPPNPSLNYGYAIIRAAIARALVGSGLLPTLGIHHHNKYNNFALADDIMEPYRPFVDILVYQQIQQISDYHVLTPNRKIEFLQLLHSDTIINNNKSPMVLAMENTSYSLIKCFESTTRKLEYPEVPDNEI